MLLTSKFNESQWRTLNIQDKYEIRHRALLEAIRFCGGVVSYSHLINVSRSRASNWVNQSKLNLPYEYVVLTEDVTQVSIERLSPFTESTNKVIRASRTKERIRTVEISLDDIIVGAFYPNESFDPEQPIIVGTDRVLIWGLAQLQNKKAAGFKKIQVLALDVMALILNIRTMSDLNFNFLLSQALAIGLRLEQLLSKQNQHSFGAASYSLNKPAPEAIERAAQILNLENKVYFDARAACLSANPNLNTALNRNDVSVQN